MATTSIAMATDLWEGTHAVDWSKTLTRKSSLNLRTPQVRSSNCTVTAACCPALAMSTKSLQTRTIWRCISLQACWLV